MVTAVHSGRVWFGDREPLHVGFLPWWRVVDPPQGKGGKAPCGARGAETGKGPLVGKIGRQGRSDGLREASEALA